MDRIADLVTDTFSNRALFNTGTIVVAAQVWIFPLVGGQVFGVRMRRSLSH